jgi:schlafen family protein
VGRPPQDRASAGHTSARWFARRPRYHLHFTPTSASWLNQVERLFGLLTDRRIRRGTFGSVRELESAIRDCLAHHNHNPKPFTWTADADSILKKIARFCMRTSAFANQNRQGGLLIIGIAANGNVVGTNHLSEQQRNSITNVDPLLRNQAAEVRTHAHTRADSQATMVTLIYAPHANHGLCETPRTTPQSLVRHDAQNAPVDQNRRTRLSPAICPGPGRCGAWGSANASLISSKAMQSS